MAMAMAHGHGHEPWPWAMGHGPWAMGHGPWAMLMAMALGHGHGHGPRAMVPRSTNDFQGHPGGFPAPMGSLRARTCAPGLASSAAWPWPGQALAKPLFFSLSSSMQFSSSSTYGIDRAGRHACKGMSPQCLSPSICGNEMFGRHDCKGLSHQCLSPSICGTESA